MVKFDNNWLVMAKSGNMAQCDVKEKSVKQMIRSFLFIDVHTSIVGLSQDHWTHCGTQLSRKASKFGFRSLMRWLMARSMQPKTHKKQQEKGTLRLCNARLAAFHLYNTSARFAWAVWLVRFEEENASTSATYCKRFLIQCGTSSGRKVRQK